MHFCGALQWRIQDFPYGGRGPRRGAWTPEAATFRKICMSKLNNWVPQGGRAPGAPALNPPMLYLI